MNENTSKVISFPSPVPSKADYQRVKSSYSVKRNQTTVWFNREDHSPLDRTRHHPGITQLAGAELTYDFQALTQFRRVRELVSGP